MLIPSAPRYVREVATVGEHFDRDNLDPPGAQLSLLRAVVATGKPVVVVLVNGRTVTFGAGPGDGCVRPSGLVERLPQVFVFVSV